MATRLVLIKDLKKREKYIQKKQLFISTDLLNKDKFIPKGYYTYKKAYMMPSNFRNRCLVTGRAKAVINKFGLSRIAFKKFAVAGLLTAVKKDSW